MAPSMAEPRRRKRGSLAKEAMTWRSGWLGGWVGKGKWVGGWVGLPGRCRGPYWPALEKAVVRIYPRGGTPH